jgi:hypothetical protein
MQTNTSITKLLHDCDDPVLSQKIEQELVNNRQHAARLANAAVSLDLLTRLAFTTSDQTGSLIHRPATPHPVAGQLPERSIPAELHDVLAANSAKSLLAVLAGMVDSASQ